MTKVAWDVVGTRTFESGLDHGVLYYYDPDQGVDVGLPWNGLVSVSDASTGSDSEPYYLDGVKYLNRRRPSDYSGTLTALTYPPEFDRFGGVLESENGISFYDQEQSGTFDLCYRTMVGNDISPSIGYKLHFLYNLTAKANDKTFQTLGDNVEAQAFEWSLTSLPAYFESYRPTSHVVVNSTRVSPSLLAEIEEIVYGTTTETPRLPTAVELNGWG